MLSEYESVLYKSKFAEDRRGSDRVALPFFRILF